MQKQTLQVGRKYRGSGWVNEYGELHFRPEQKGTKPTNLHLVQEHENYSLYESDHIFKVVIKFEKRSFDVRQASSKMFFIVSQILTYLK